MATVDVVLKLVGFYSIYEPHHRVKAVVFDKIILCKYCNDKNYLYYESKFRQNLRELWSELVD